jgi:hypothetical protein
MNELKRELIDESSTLSSSRWSLVIGAYIICFLIGKPLPDGFFGWLQYIDYNHNRYPNYW